MSKSCQLVTPASYLFVSLSMALGCEPVQVGSTRGRATQGGQSNHIDFGGSAGRLAIGVGAAPSYGPGSGGAHSPTSGGPAAHADAGGAPPSGGTAGAARTTASGALGDGGGAAGRAFSGGESSSGGAVIPWSGGASTGGTPAVAGAQARAGDAGTPSSAGMSGIAGTTPVCTDGKLAIRGRVLSPRGEALSGVRVTSSGWPSTESVTNADGEYVLSRLCPGEHLVTPSHPDLKFCSASARFESLTQNAYEDFTGSPSGCTSAEISTRVGIIVFDPLVPDGRGGTVRLTRARGWHDGLDLANQYRRSIEGTTNGRVRFEVGWARIVDGFPTKFDGFEYTPESYLQCLEALPTPPEGCHALDPADYLRIANSQKICDDADEHSIDEVWLFGGPYFGFPLLQRFGTLGPNEPGAVRGSTCTRAINVFGFNYERGVNALLQGVHIEMEGQLRRLYEAWYPGVADTAFARFVATSEIGSVDSVAGCGSYRFAPTSTQPWEFDNSRTVRSHCDDFYDYPAAVATPPRSIDCRAWGCSDIGYERYWFGHLPAARGVAPDGFLADWWQYLLKPEAFTASARGSQVNCSTSYQAGWCENLRDRRHGSCNDGEWATSNHATGWVEVTWPSLTSVRSVTLYDRACPERVLRGHLEFSDGSPEVAFGMLEDSGRDGLAVTFPRKQLTWMRIHIDESSGGENPGFGEIFIEETTYPAP